MTITNHHIVERTTRKAQTRPAVRKSHPVKTETEISQKGSTLDNEVDIPGI